MRRLWLHKIHSLRRARVAAAPSSSIGVCSCCRGCAAKRISEPLHCPRACSRCLQACQVAGFASQRRTTCGVCLQRYSEQLDVPEPPDLQAGDLLLASPSMSGTFRGSVRTPPTLPSSPRSSFLCLMQNSSRIQNSFERHSSASARCCLSTIYKSKRRIGLHMTGVTSPGHPDVRVWTTGPRCCYLQRGSTAAYFSAAAKDSLLRRRSRVWRKVWCGAIHRHGIKLVEALRGVPTGRAGARRRFSAASCCDRPRPRRLHG